VKNLDRPWVRPSISFSIAFSNQASSWYQVFAITAPSPLLIFEHPVDGQEKLCSLFVLEN
jgi:hypothetical protein